MFPESPTLAEELDALDQGHNPTLAANDAGPDRRQLDLLLQHVLSHCGGDYACVITPTTMGSPEQSITLSAAAERGANGDIHSCHDTLTCNRPDPLTLSVMSQRRVVCGKPMDVGLPACLPVSRPPIRLFFMLPIEDGSELTSLLFVANPDGMQSMSREHPLLQDVAVLIDTLTNRKRVALPVLSTNDGSRDPDLGVRHYVQLMTASINAVIITNSKGVITGLNPAADHLFGWGDNGAIGTSLERALPPEFVIPVLRRSRTFDTPNDAGDTLPVCRQSVAATKQDDTVAHLTCSAYHTRVADEVYTTFILEPESESAPLHNNSSSHQQFKALTNVAPVGIVQLSADWTCDYANEMWCQLSGLTMDETLGEGWVDGIHAEDVVNTLVDLREALSNNRIFSSNIRLQRPTGKVCWVTLSATITLNDAGLFDGCLLVLLDITEAHLASEKLRYSANHDALTGLANRSHFLDRLQALLDVPQTRATTSLLYLDLDGFKAINDSLGHDYGDQLLREVASRMLSLVEEQDLCARLGGDEFTVIVRSVVDPDAVSQLAENIVRSFGEPFVVFDNELSLSTSIGIAIGDESISNADNLIKRADTALYKAKSSGRSRWVVYCSEIEREDIQLSLLQARVHRATERKEFSVVYQPQYRLEDGSIVGFEALLRWHPTDIDVPDTQTLVDVLEETGLMNDVGQWVLETACQQYYRWEVMGLLSSGCSMSVNVSPSQLTLTNFTTRLRAILHRCQMSATDLTLEITESALIEKDSSCIPVLNEIKSMGVRIGLDDFGTGYSSLSYLTRLPIDYLKIDKSFVMAMEADEPSRNIVSSVMALAQTLNLGVVAEGVENQSTLEALRQSDCHFAQGFLYCRPCHANALEPLLVRDSLNQHAHIQLG